LLFATYQAIVFHLW